MKLKTVLKGKSHKVVIYENDDDSEAYLEHYYQLFNNVTQSHHNLMSFLLEKTAEWYISEQGERAKQFFENLQQAASSADWGVATVTFDNEEWIFPYPIPAINNGTIVLSDWMGNEIEINKYQAGVVLLAFLFQRGEGPGFFRRPMLTGNLYNRPQQCTLENSYEPNKHVGFGQNWTFIFLHQSYMSLIYMRHAFQT